MEFQRGDVFLCHFPNKMLRSAFTPPPDYTRIEQETALAVCLTDSHNRFVPSGQTLVVPIIPKNVQLRSGESARPTVVPIKQDQLNFLRSDSYALTYHVTPMNKHWMRKKVGSIHPESSVMQRIDLGILMSTGTYENIRQTIIHEVNSKILEMSRHNHRDIPQHVLQEIQLSVQQLAPHHPVRPPDSMPTMADFKRGDVFVCRFPSVNRKGQRPPDYSIKGVHMGICLTDAKDPMMPSNQVIIVPISTAEAAVQKGYLKPTHVSLQKAHVPFLKHDSFALTFQANVYNRHWLTQPVGSINHLPTMDRIDLALLLSTGTYPRVANMINDLLQEVLKQKVAPARAYSQIYQQQMNMER